MTDPELSAADLANMEEQDPLDDLDQFDIGSLLDSVNLITSMNNHERMQGLQATLSEAEQRFRFMYFPKFPIENPDGSLALGVVPLEYIHQRMNDDPFFGQMLDMVNNHQKHLGMLKRLRRSPQSHMWVRRNDLNRVINELEQLSLSA
jgi:hypothetical protein